MAKFIIGLVLGFSLAWMMSGKFGSSEEMLSFFSPSGKKRVQVIARDIGAETKDLERAARSSWASIGNTCGEIGFTEVDSFREGNDLVFIGECKGSSGLMGMFGK